MIKTYYLTILFLLSFSLIQSNSNKDEVKSFIIDTDKSSALIMCEQGMKFSIKLKNFTATGYSWEVEHQFGDDITFVNKNIITNVNMNKTNNQPTMMGGVQVEEFIYSVSSNLKSSSVKVDFILKRPWEKDPVKRISVLITFDKI